MDLLIPIAIVTTLILLNGLFVAAEFAIVGAPRATIEHWAERGYRGARRVQRILSEPRQQDRFIATAQIGITLASVGLGMYGEHQLAQRFEPWLEPWATYPWLTAHVLASVIAVAILTCVHIVIGEMVPKALSLQHAATTAVWVAPFMGAVQAALAPLVLGLNAAGNGILALVGIRRQESGADRYHTAEELQFIIQESQEGGLLRGEAGNILRELFEFGDLTAGEVMVPRVQAIGIPAGAEPEALRAIVRAHPHTRYPVYEGDLDRIVGSIHVKDVLRHLLSNRPVLARDARPLPHVPGPAQLDRVVASMRRYRAQMAVVMDQHGGTAGLVTMEDLFEEVVGDIEEGQSRTPIVRQAPGVLRVRGTVRLAEVGDALGRVLEHPRVTTVSGLVLLLLGGPAYVGAVVTFNGIRFEVTETAGRGVRRALVTAAGS